MRLVYYEWASNEFHMKLSRMIDIIMKFKFRDGPCLSLNYRFTLGRVSRLFQLYFIIS